MNENVILTVDQMRTADRLSIKGDKSGFDLMSEAGRQVYEIVCRQLIASDRILVACGSGNNGGDGLIAAKQLSDDGLDVTVALLGSSDALRGDARLALDQWNSPVLKLSETQPCDFTVIVDAILGTGIDRSIYGELANWISKANAHSAVIVSVDIPTGISGDSGAVMGVAIEAQHTVTFFRKKTGHLLFPGRYHCGQVHVRHIGIEDKVIESLQPRFYENDSAMWQTKLPDFGWDSHKYTKGHTVVVTGNALSSGAARLAARAALRTGAGLVTLACPQSAAHVIASQVTCEMIETVNTANDLSSLLGDNRITSIVLGPGMGVGLLSREMVRAAINSSASVVLDADALTSFEDCQDDLFQMIKGNKAHVVMTPHSGEYSRLFGDVLKSMSGLTGHSDRDLPPLNKLDLSTEAATLSGATIVLKGADTVIASPSGKCSINTNSPPWLATAGSGDVLAGTIAGWLAQGATDYDAACAGCWMHGEAALAYGPGLIASDIADMYPLVHHRLQGNAGLP